MKIPTSVSGHSAVSLFEFKTLRHVCDSSTVLIGEWAENMGLLADGLGHESVFVHLVFTFMSTLYQWQ